MGGYLHPVIVNGKEIHEMEMNEDISGRLYVYVDFVKSGRHFYNVNFNDKFYLHRTIIRNREEEIPLFHKKLSFKKKEFKPEDHLWSEVIEDLESGYSKDADLWKINNFVKKHNDLEDITKYLTSNYLLLQKVFTFLRAWGGNIGYLETDILRLVCKMIGFAISSGSSSE